MLSIDTNIGPLLASGAAVRQRTLSHLATPHHGASFVPHQNGKALSGSAFQLR